MNDGKVLAVWMDDRDQRREAWVRLVKQYSGAVLIETEDNRLLIPFQRLLKIKQRVRGKEDERCDDDSNRRAD